MFKSMLVAVAAFLLFGDPAMAEDSTFDRDAVGSVPAGWVATKTGRGAPRWAVEEDPTAPSKSKVVKQSGQASYPLLLKEGTALTDGYVETRFKPVAGSEDRAGGVVWRAKDADNYYVVRANALEGNVVAYKTIGGVRSAMDIVGRRGGYGVKALVPSGQWHTLRVDFRGSRFQIAFDGQALFEVEDATFTGPGMIGLWTKADSVTVFDGCSWGSAR